MLMAVYKTLEGKEIDLSGLTEKEKSFLAKADALLAKGVAWDAFQNFYLNRKSAVWFEGGDPKADRKATTKVTRSPLYRVLQDKAGRLGIEQGFLRPGDGQVRKNITLEQFEEKKRGK